VNHHFTPKTELQEGLIQPRRNKNDPLVDPDVILTFIKADMDYLLSLCPNQNIKLFDQGFFRFGKLVFEPHAGITVASPLLGAPQAVMAMEKLIALGGRRFWALGWCGSLQPQIKIGDFIIPLNALSEEGTSTHYPITQAHPQTDPELNDRLTKALEPVQTVLHKGPVWTTDAPYRETPQKIKTYQQQGVLAVEMEISALITLAHFRNVQAAGLLVVSDELGKLKWKTGFHLPALKTGSQSACRALVQAITQVVKR
jgi:uridine phosphorylase